MRLRLTFILILAIGSLVSCKKSKQPNFHFEYFGLEQGRYVVYEVMEITHNQDLAIHDTLRYQLKTKWGDTIIDNEGRIAREFLRYTRANSGEPWVLQDVWTGLIDGIRAELIEENQRTVKLVFAPTLSKSWDANAYNMFDPLDCYYRDIHRDTVISGVNLDSTLVVEQEDYTSLIDTVRKYEVYAKHIGLVRKYFRDNAYQFGSAEVVLGRELFYDFIQTGIE
jgi:hypothetical protein